MSDGAIQRHRRHWQKDVLDVRRQAEAAYHFALLADGARRCSYGFRMMNR